MKLPGGYSTMRTELKKVNNKRLKFIATVCDFGSKANYKGPPSVTICFCDVKFFETKDAATDHVWMTCGKRLESAGLEIGDTVTFEARVMRYIKGYVNMRRGIDERQIDYRLAYINNIKKHQPNGQI